MYFPQKLVHLFLTEGMSHNAQKIYLHVQANSSAGYIVDSSNSQISQTPSPKHPLLTGNTAPPIVQQLHREQDQFTTNSSQCAEQDSICFLFFLIIFFFNFLFFSVQIFSFQFLFIPFFFFFQFFSFIFFILNAFFPFHLESYNHLTAEIAKPGSTQGFGKASFIS